MYNIDDMIVVGRLFLVFAVIAITSFPVLYLFSPWKSTPLGRAIMLQAVAFAFTIWLKLVLTFFLNDDTRTFLLWTNAFALILLGIATPRVTYLLWQIQNEAKREAKDEDRSSTL